MLIDKIKNFFSIPRSQKIGVFILILILIFVIFCPKIYKNFFFKPKQYNYENDIKEIETFLLNIRYNNESNKNKKFEDNYKSFDFDKAEKSTAILKLNPFYFDPNETSEEQWIKMGFSERQVKGIKNFEAKGGRYFTKNDVKKLYSISSEEFEIIEKYILLPDSINTNNKKIPKLKENIVVDINRADTSLLKTIPGIGSYFAKQIFNYCSKLGGFYSKSQLLEIKYMDSTKLNNIEHLIEINLENIKKININTADFEELYSHPYINKNVANSIVNYRKNHGQYNTTDEIMNSVIINKDLYNKISPYLTIE